MIYGPEDATMGGNDVIEEDGLDSLFTQSTFPLAHIKIIIDSVVNSGRNGDSFVIVLEKKSGSSLGKMLSLIHCYELVNYGIVLDIIRSRYRDYLNNFNYVLVCKFCKVKMHDNQ